MRWGRHAGVLSDHDPIDAVREIGSPADDQAVDPVVIAAGLREIGYQGALILIETSPHHRPLEAAYHRYVHC